MELIVEVQRVALMGANQRRKKMTLENELGVFWMASFFSIIDLTLTYYILWYDRKINPKTPKMRELNPVAKLIMKTTNNNAIGLLISALFTQSLIWGVGTYAIKDPITAIGFGNFVAGALMVAIWIHLYSIQMLHKTKKDRDTISELIKRDKDATHN